MGIENFSTYLGLNNPNKPNERYFERFQLRNSMLIVDGGIATSICQSAKDDPRFGSDYYLIRDATHDYFKRFKECGVEPIVLMDGIYEKEKEATMQYRLERSLEDMREYNRSKYRYTKSLRIHPILKTYAFVSALEDLKIPCFRCDFEADPELAELARVFNCPVLSYDSDFALCNGVTCIPFQYPQTWKDAPYKHIECFRFNREEFIRQHGLNDPSLLPLLAVIFRSDHWKHNTCEALFGDRAGGYIFDMIRSATNWLRGKTVYFAKDEIISSLLSADESLNREDLSKDFDFTINLYNNSWTTLSSTLNQNEITKHYAQRLARPYNIAENDMVKKYGVPSQLMDLVRKCRIFSTVLDIFTLNKFLCRSNTIEEMDFESIYEPSVHLIEGIYGLLIRNPGDKKHSALELKMRTVHATGFRKIRRDALPFPKGNLSEEQKNEILQTITCLENHGDLRYSLDVDWYIFILALTYIHKKCNAYFFQNHAHAVLLTAFILNIVKRSKEISPEIEDHDDDYDDDDEDDYHYDVDVEESIPSDYIKDFKRETYVQIANKAKTLQILKSGNHLQLSEISHIHLYLSFQVSLHLLIQVFYLLKLPDKIQVEDFVAGSFYHKIFLGLNEALNWREYVRTFSNNSEEFFEAYSKLVTRLQKYLPL